MKLSHALRANAAFCTLCAAICLICAQTIARLCVLPGDIWAFGLGLMLASYVPILLVAAARPVPWLVKAIIVADWGYVAIALLHLICHLGQIKGAGMAIIVISTWLVAVFAVLQMRGLTAQRNNGVQ